MLFSESHRYYTSSYHGAFRIWLPQQRAIILPPEPDIVISNRLTTEGEQELLKMIFQDVTTIAGGSNWYIGLCNETPDESAGLADISTEPTSAGGYARQALVRNATDWPTVTTVNGHVVIRSATVTFSASGADFSGDITRAFLTSASSGTSGKLYSFSGALTTALTVVDGQSFAMQYEAYLG